MNRTEKEEYIIGSIFLLANKLNQIGDQILPDITFKQLMLLVTISKMDSDEKNINSIAKFMGTSRQNIKKMLMVLETKEYVTMSKSKHDARALQVDLTEKTYQYFSVNMNITTKQSNQLFAMYSNKEIDTCLDNLQKLLSGLAVFDERVNIDE